MTDPKPNPGGVPTLLKVPLAGCAGCAGGIVCLIVLVVVGASIRALHIGALDDLFRFGFGLLMYPVERIVQWDEAGHHGHFYENPIGYVSLLLAYWGCLGAAVGLAAFILRRVLARKRAR
jgi:hypothetical protein